jgi:hypothetical protein
MKKLCNKFRCGKVADFVVQWGPDAKQKEYTCIDHLTETIDDTPAIEFFVVKIQKINKGS